MYSNFDYDDEYDEILYCSLRGIHADSDVMDCEAYYGERSHISIDGGQRQPLDAELWQPADLLEVFRYVSVIHMTEHIEDAIDIMHDATIAMNGVLRADAGSVVCGRLEIQFPAIEWEDVLHYLESVK